jgi:hypothetical protein
LDPRPTVVVMTTAVKQRATRFKPVPA